MRFLEERESFAFEKVWSVSILGMSALQCVVRTKGVSGAKGEQASRCSGSGIESRRRRCGRRIRNKNDCFHVSLSPRLHSCAYRYDFHGRGGKTGARSFTSRTLTTLLEPVSKHGAYLDGVHFPGVSDTLGAFAFISLSSERIFWKNERKARGKHGHGVSCNVDTRATKVTQSGHTKSLVP